MIHSPQTGSIFPQTPYPTGSPQFNIAASRPHKNTNVKEDRPRSTSPDVMIVAETPPQLNPAWLVSLHNGSIDCVV